MITGRIIRVLSGFYTVHDGNNAVVCKARGKFRKDDLKPLVGDICDYTQEGNNEGYIMKIHPRKNALIRPPVANIDQAIIVVSAKEPDFSTVLLDRFLALIEHEDIEPIIMVTKMDLVNANDSIFETLDQYRKANYRIITTSQDEVEISDEIKTLFKNKITVITGQSGVGKSSFLNRIMPNLELKTGEISNVLGRGKHTTRHVELFELFGGWVADTPGFSSLELNMTDRELATSFHDFKMYSASCKFRGCLHKSEPGCGVKEAVENGDITQERYQHYLQFLEEISLKKGKY